MPKKIKTARIALLIQAWLSLIASVVTAIIVVAMFFLSTNSQDSPAEFGIIFGTIGLIVITAGIASAILYFVTAKGLGQQKPWARIMAIVLGALILFNFPIGTVLGILILIGVLGTDSGTWFQKNNLESS